MLFSKISLHFIFAFLAGITFFVFAIYRILLVPLSATLRTTLVLTNDECESLSYSIKKIEERMGFCLVFLYSNYNIIALNKFDKLMSDSIYSRHKI